MAAQNYKNHSRFDPKFHFFLIPLLLVCFVASIYHLVKQHSPANALLVPLSFAALFTALVARMYALQVQDRVIRLEEQTRLRRLGVDPDGLGLKQYVALRFAADEEVGPLAARTKAENLLPKQIKEAIVNWRADDYRV